MPRRSSITVAALAAAALALVPLPAGAEEATPAASDVRTYTIVQMDPQAELQRVELRLRLVAERLDFVNREYVITAPAGDPERFTRRMDRAKFLANLRDYTAAAVILYDLLEDQANRSHPLFYEAMDLLANTLYLDKNYFAARGYYRRLVEQGGRKFFLPSLKRLIEIASETGNYDGLETYFNLIKQTDPGAMPSDVYYMLGRSLYLRGDQTRALEVFGRVNDSSPLFLQARYFIGTILLKVNRLNDALATFLDIAGRVPSTPAAKTMLDLAQLAIGRLYYEQGKYLEATEAYQRVDSKSDMFEDAMYEVAWIHIKSGQLEKALDMLDILLLSTREVPVVLQARVLRGNILLKMGKYDDAVESFQTVIDRYAPIKDNLRILLDQHDDPVAYFEKLLGEGLAKVETARAIPEVVVKWATMDKSVAKAVSVVKDLEGTRKSLEEAFKVFNKVHTTLESENRINMFPVFKEAMMKGLEVKSELDRIRRQLQEIEDTIIVGKLAPHGLAEAAADVRNANRPSENEVEDLRAAREQRERLEKMVEQMPKGQEGYQKRSLEYAKRLQDLEQVAYKMSLDIDAIRAQLTAIDKWFFESPDRRSGEPDLEKRFVERIRQEWAGLDELSGELKEVMGTIDTEKNRMGLASDMTQDEKVRQQYREALETERKVLDRLRKKLPADALQLVERIDAMRARVNQFYADIDRLSAGLEKAMVARAAELKEKVLTEKKNLDAYDSEAGGMHKDTENLVGRIAYNGFRQAHRKFYDIVLKADIGIIDVVWKQKEDQRNNILKIQADLDKEMKAVSDEFTEAAGQ